MFWKAQTTLYKVQWSNNYYGVMGAQTIQGSECTGKLLLHVLAPITTCTNVYAHAAVGIIWVEIDSLHVARVEAIVLSGVSAPTCEFEVGVRSTPLTQSTLTGGLANTLYMFGMMLAGLSLSAV